MCCIRVLPESRRCAVESAVILTFSPAQHDTGFPEFEKAVVVSSTDMEVTVVEVLQSVGALRVQAGRIT